MIGCLALEGSKTRVGVAMTSQVRLLDMDKVVETVFTRARSMTIFLNRGLSNVYSGEDTIVINNVRQIVDLRTHLREIRKHGAASMSSYRYPENVYIFHICSFQIFINAKYMHINLSWTGTRVGLMQLCSSRGTC